MLAALEVDKFKKKTLDVNPSATNATNGGATRTQQPTATMQNTAAQTLASESWFGGGAEVSQEGRREEKEGTRKNLIPAGWPRGGGGGSRGAECEPSVGQEGQEGGVEAVCAPWVLCPYWAEAAAARASGLGGAAIGRSVHVC